MAIKTYLQIDYIDKEGKAIFIDTYHDMDVALKRLYFANLTSKNIEGRNAYVLDLYAYDNDTDEDNESYNKLIVKNIGTATEEVLELT